MTTPSPVALASTILAAPGWTRVGLAAPSEHMKQAAALELATLIAERIVLPAEPALEGQMALPF